MVGKKGYVYFIEMILAVIILTVVLVGFTETEHETFAYKQQQDMREVAWQSLKNLDEMNVLDNVFANNNYSKLDNYIKEELPSTASYDLELWNGSCYPIDSGVIQSGSTTCDTINASTESDMISVYYTWAQSNEPQTIRLFVWRLM